MKHYHHIHTTFSKIYLIYILAILLLPVAKSNQPPFACDASNPSTNSYPFCQTKLPIAKRAKNLVSRLNVDEKVTQLVNSAAGIPRLGIPAYEWWSEALHGVAEIVYAGVPQGVRFNSTIRSATSFPQAIVSAATFDRKLWYLIGKAIATEARAIYNSGQATGMTFWAPNINIFRDPRWGRGQETPGEDPLVASNYAVSYVRGLQGDSFEGGQLKDGHLQASVCCKHFTAYDLDAWKNVDRYKFNAIVNKQDLADTYQPPFQSCVQKGRASGIMCAYNRVNGVPNCADYNLLTNVARKQWGFQGYIASDCDAVAIIHESQGYAKEPEDAVADVLKAGMDVNCGRYLQRYTKSALDKKKITIADVDRALENLFSIRMRLGLFNGNPSKLLYGNIGRDQVCSKTHQSLALLAALNGIVLLKNDRNLLPFPKTRKLNSLSVIGPNADAAKTLLGNYEGPPCLKVSPLLALRKYANNVVYAQGCQSVQCGSAVGIAEAVEAAKKGDEVVLVMGLDQTWERESHDREELTLPGYQQSLIEKVAESAKKPVVLVLVCGGPVDVSFAKSNPKIGAILWAGYPGEAGGFAIAQVLFGEHNPGGKLPVTWYPKDYTKIPMTDMRMRPDPSSGYLGRTYRFYKGPKVFEFGFGLHYTKYTYNFASHTKNKLNLNKIFTTQQVKNPTGLIRSLSVADMDSEICENSKFSAFVGVQNSREMDGKHPVLLFIRHINPSNGTAIKQLVGFESVHLKRGERVEIEFELNPCEHLSRANEEGLMVIEEGSRLLSVGDVEYQISVEL